MWHLFGVQIMGIFKSHITEVTSEAWFTLTVVFELDYAGKYLCLMFVHNYHDFYLDGFFVGFF